MDPDGDALAPAARTAPKIRRQKIIQNLALLREHFATHLTEARRRRMSVEVADVVLPIGVIWLDTALRSGNLVLQRYPAGTPAECSPFLELHADRDQPWYKRYLFEGGQRLVSVATELGKYVTEAREFLDQQDATRSRYR